MSSPLAYLQRSRIETGKWNACIRRAPNGRIYAESFFLDAVADRWDALVLGDYEAVMPLPWRKKWGLQYIYQPPFAAQLGVFGQGLSAATLQLFLAAIPTQFRLVEISLNAGNRFAIDLALPDRLNHSLSLAPGYDSLYRAYRENSRRNIRKALQYGCQVQRMIPVDDIIALASQQEGQQETQEAAFESFRQLPRHYPASETYGVYMNGALLASAAFIVANGRAYYLLVGNHPNGRTLGASHLLIDAFIKDHAGTPLVLDFEGSDIRSLAFFYSSFGATVERYPFLRLNRLPFFMKWLKG